MVSCLPDNPSQKKRFLKYSLEKAEAGVRAQYTAPETEMVNCFVQGSNTGGFAVLGLEPLTFNQQPDLEQIPEEPVFLTF